MQTRPLRPQNLKNRQDSGALPIPPPYRGRCGGGAMDANGSTIGPSSVSSRCDRCDQGGGDDDAKRKQRCPFGVPRRRKQEGRRATGETGRGRVCALPQQFDAPSVHPPLTMRHYSPAETENPRFYTGFANRRLSVSPGSAGTTHKISIGAGESTTPGGIAGCRMSEKERTFLSRSARYLLRSNREVRYGHRPVVADNTSSSPIS